MKCCCEKCGSVLIIGEKVESVDELKVYPALCPLCEAKGSYKPYMQPIPDYETPEQFEKRTGKPYPDNGLVWVKMFKKTWECNRYDVARNVFTPVGHTVVIADPPVAPPDGWEPGEV